MDKDGQSVYQLWQISNLLPLRAGNLSEIFLIIAKKCFPSGDKNSMSDTKRRLKRALNAVESSISTLRRTRSRVDEGRSDIDRALRELDDAEHNIRRAIRELPTDFQPRSLCQAAAATISIVPTPAGQEGDSVQLSLSIPCTKLK